jgi:hypothetical protein
MSMELVDTITTARGPKLKAAVERAAREVTSKTSDELASAVAAALASGRARDGDALADFFIAALKRARDISGTQIELATALEQALPATSLPVARRMFEKMNEAFLADRKLIAKVGVERWKDWIPSCFEWEDIRSPRERARLNVWRPRAADVIFPALELSLTCSAGVGAESVWAYALTILAHAPSRQGLPAQVKGLGKKALGFTHRAGIEEPLRLLKAGLACADKKLAWVIIGDAIFELEKVAPAAEHIVALAHDMKPSARELATFSKYLAAQKSAGAALATLALTWADGASDRKTASALRSALGKLGVETGDGVAPSGKKVLTALGKKRLEEARAMLKRGARMEDPGCTPDGAIHLLQDVALPDAVRFSLIELMLENGLSVDDTGRAGNTGLQRACDSGDYSLARFLLEHDAWVDADMDTASGHNATSLHVAAERGDKRFVQLLLKHGANPKIKDWKGETAIDVADGKVKGLLLAAKRKKTRR